MCRGVGSAGNGVTVGMQQDSASILRDVELRLRALEEVRRLRTLVVGATEQLQAAKDQAARAESGTLAEQQYLREAAEASARLAGLRENLYLAERELRRTAYLLPILSE
jgi:putative NADH-flavin reductase